MFAAGVDFGGSVKVGVGVSVGEIVGFDPENVLFRVTATNAIMQTAKIMETTKKMAVVGLIG